MRLKSAPHSKCACELNSRDRGGISQTVNDPLYSEFVRIMAEMENEEPELSEAVLSPKRSNCVTRPPKR